MEAGDGAAAPTMQMTRDGDNGAGGTPSTVPRGEIERAMVDTPQGEGEMERNQEAAPPGGRRRSIEDKFSLFRREESVTSPKSS